MAEPNLKSIQSRRKKAQSEYDSHKPLRDDAFDYAIPYRRSANTGSTSKGASRVDKAFDQTAIVSNFRFAGKLWKDLIGDEPFQIKAGDILPQKEKDELAGPLEGISKVSTGMMSNGEFDMAFVEMGLELGAGTGAMLILEGNRKKPARFVCVPIDEVLLEAGAYGDITGIFWGRKWTVRAIREMFPDGKFGKTLRDLEEKDPEKEVVLNQDCIYNSKTDRWDFIAWSPEDDETIIKTKSSRTCPWLTPRYFRVPGEVYGRGPINLAMPSIKTLNTAQRLTLQAAAISLLGIYTAVDDGVFNPDMASVEPGEFWKVARNGGVLGPSVQKFPEPRLDLNNIVLNDLRMGVKTTMMDQALPPDSGAVRSATEILERMKRLAEDHVGAFGRLVKEIIVPLAERLIEIAYDKGMITDAPDIDQILVKIQVSSPMATARAAEKMQKIIQWIEMCQALLAQDARKVVKMVEALLHIGSEMGVPESLKVNADERKKMEEDDRAMLAAQMAAQSGLVPGAAAAVPTEAEAG
ncbi:Bacteriophage head to tail connecting protein [Pseudovibrio denitrificans]|uniref:Bacteriophage head to tail connecting protein n=1 Tax=Pseudovibrio denitrificans TaxID=258256 RepID=A0A1I6ZWS7_9HYPH|nr:portal protein [Pseudovibrio denitrificans]SFT67096.1 Bacteriophage head to tail connecting protein [Pseudovibrio denitrificans]